MNPYEELANNMRERASAMEKEIKRLRTARIVFSAVLIVYVGYAIYKFFIM